MPNQSKVVVVVVDGVGIAPQNPGNAVALAHTPTFDAHWGKDPFAPFASEGKALSARLIAHGSHVGLPDGVMGNSEVGHSTIFCGKPYDELLPAINKGIKDGSLFQAEAWQEAIRRSSGETGGCVHFLGLLSDGQVHSDINHVLEMMRNCAASGVSKVRLWCLTDGRDVPPSSAQDYLEQVENLCAEINASSGMDYSIAMVAGRAATLMDRGEDDWGRVEQAWNALFHKGGTLTNSASEAIAELRGEKSGSFTDENLGLRLIRDSKGEAPQIAAGDSLVLFNYRTDRIVEFCSWMLGQELTAKAKSQGVKRQPAPADVLFVTMADFDPATLPLENYLLPQLQIDTTLVQFLGQKGARIFCVSEPSKFPHVTLFPNGRSNEKPDHCVWHLVESKQRPPFNRLPMMQSVNVALAATEAMERGEEDLLIVNFPSPDMVGHEMSLEAAISAVEAADYGMAEICRKAQSTGHTVVYGGDHGNAERMFVYEDGKIIKENGKAVWHTAHTVNPVRWVIYDPSGAGGWKLNDKLSEASLGNLSATVAQLLGFDEVPAHWLPSLLQK
jgi:2,3-bisphosphoglycerate-independent phosphoglycerate mutase